MSFVVLYDANVLYPSTLRDLLIRIAQAGLVQAKWTDQILDEVFGNLATNRPDLDPRRLARTRDLMNRAVRDCLVTGYEPLVDALDLTDPNDRHVLAAAIKARAQVIVTRNLKDFPSTVLEEWDMEAKSADAFILDQIDLNPDSVHGAVQRTPRSAHTPSHRPWRCPSPRPESAPTPSRTSTTSTRHFGVRRGEVGIEVKSGSRARSNNPRSSWQASAPRSATGSHAPESFGVDRDEPPQSPPDPDPDQPQPGTRFASTHDAAKPPGRSAELRAVRGLEIRYRG